MKKMMIILSCIMLSTIIILKWHSEENKNKSINQEYLQEHTINHEQVADKILNFQQKDMGFGEIPFGTSDLYSTYYSKAFLSNNEIKENFQFNLSNSDDLDYWINYFTNFDTESSYSDFDIEDLWFFTNIFNACLPKDNLLLIDNIEKVLKIAVTNTNSSNTIYKIMWLSNVWFDNPYLFVSNEVIGTLIKELESDNDIVSKFDSYYYLIKMYDEFEIDFNINIIKQQFENYERAILNLPKDELPVISLYNYLLIAKRFDLQYLMAKAEISDYIDSLNADGYGYGLYPSMSSNPFSIYYVGEITRLLDLPQDFSNIQTQMNINQKTNSLYHGYYLMETSAMNSYFAYSILNDAQKNISNDLKSYLGNYKHRNDNIPFEKAYAFLLKPLISKDVSKQEVAEILDYMYTYDLSNRSGSSYEQCWVILMNEILMVSSKNNIEISTENINILEEIVRSDFNENNVFDIMVYNMFSDYLPNFKNKDCTVIDSQDLSIYSLSDFHYFSYIYKYQSNGYSKNNNKNFNMMKEEFITTYLPLVKDVGFGAFDDMKSAYEMYFCDEFYLA